MAQAARKPAEPAAAPKRAKPPPVRAKPSVQRKPKPEKDEVEDRKSVLLGGGVQAKRMAQRTAANGEDSAPDVQRKAAEEETPAATPSVQAKPFVQRMTLLDAQIDEAKKLADAGTGVRIQKAGFVSSPEDASEREADRVADAVVSSPAPKAAVGRVTTGVQRKESADDILRAGQSGGSDIEVEARIKAAAVGGKPMSKKTRALLEPRFDADFSGVRIHDDAQAARLATRIGARAFAYSNHIFFNEGQYQPDTIAGRHLLAHELTHTIQQKAAVQRKGAGGAAGAQIGESTGPQASRLGVSDALDFFAEAAYNIPGFRMFTILLGVNPINMRDVERTAANILRAIVEFLPGGRLITAVLDMYNVFEDVGAWVEEQMDSLGISGASIRASINEFLDSLSWSDIFDLDGVWERAKRIFTDPIDGILTFIGSLFDKILEFVQKAVLAPISALIEPTEGYGLLKQILGYDPITGEEVERDIGAIIGGLLTLAGQEELWNNIQEANALERIGEWFFTAIDSLIALVVSIPDRFVEAFETIEITEFMDLPGAIAKVLGVFGGIVLDFGAWILDTVFTLLKIIVEVVAPAVIPYLQKAGKAFDTIINDPIGFVGNLVAAAKKGFQLFFQNFIPNLRGALIQWLTGAMAGANIHIPQAFTLQEILKFVLSVLGLTWENVRPKLVRVLGETAVTALETGFELVTTLVTEGPAAAWQQIVEMIGNLRDMVIEQIISFVTDKVIEQAVIKLVSFLNPAGALIQAIIAIYNTVMFFVERLTQIAQVAGAFIDSIADIAEGKIDGAAAKVEQTMVGLLSLVISFLARLVGLGNVARAVTDLIEKLRRPIDQAIDRLIDWIVRQARRFMGAVRSGVARVVSWWRTRKPLTLPNGDRHTIFFEGNERGARLKMASEEKPVEDHLTDALADDDLSSAAKGRARIALNFFTQHLAPFSGTTLPDPMPAALQAKRDALPDRINDFAELIRGIPDQSDDAMPNAAFGWNGPDEATAELLSNRGSRGGRDARSGNPAGWRLLQHKGVTNDGDRWVRMHMISAAYGGQDVDGNLIPAPTAVNTGSIVRGFETSVEETLYGSETAGNVRRRNSLFNIAQRRAVIWLKTKSNGYHPAVAVPAAISDDGSYFATSVTFTGGLHYKNGANWDKDPRALISATAPIKRPTFPRTYRPNLNTIGRNTITERTGISDRFAMEIISERGGTPAARRHANVADFASRMTAYRIANGQPISGAFNGMIAAVGAAYGDKKRSNGEVEWYWPQLNFSTLSKL